MHAFSRFYWSGQVFAVGSLSNLSSPHITQTKTPRARARSRISLFCCSGPRCGRGFGGSLTGVRACRGGRRGRRGLRRCRGGAGGRRGRSGRILLRNFTPFLRISTTLKGPWPILHRQSRKLYPCHQHTAVALVCLAPPEIDH